MPLERIYRDISFGDSSNVDSFSKVRTTEVTDYDYIDFRYATATLPSTSNNFNYGMFYNSAYTGAGFFASHTAPQIDANDRGVCIHTSAIVIGTTSYVELRSRRSISATPGSTIYAYISFKFHGNASPNASTAISVGLGSDNSELALDYACGFIGLSLDNSAITATNPLGIAAILRLPSGSGISTLAFFKDNWYDRFDGTGPSGIILDFNKIQVLTIKYKPDGFGKPIEFGFMVGGEYYVGGYYLSTNSPAFVNNNNFVYARPSFRQLLNKCMISVSAVTTLGSSLPTNSKYITLFSGVVLKEQNKEEILPTRLRTYSTSHSNLATISAGASANIITFRRKLTLNSNPISAYAAIKSITFISTASVPVRWELHYNNTNTAAFTSLNSESVLEFNKPSVLQSKTAGGVNIDTGFIAAGEVKVIEISKSIKNMWQMVTEIVGGGGTTNYTYLSITITPIGSNITANQIGVSVTVEEEIFK
jgi:hypothetical protein